MWIAFGLLFIAAGLLGPRFGFGLFQSGQPRLKSSVRSTLANRIATILIGVLLTAFGLMRFYPK
jgi:hypothetical protein